MERVADRAVSRKACRFGRLAPWLLLSLTIVFAAAAPRSAAARRSPSALPVLHTFRAAHVLSLDKAQRGYPIHIARAQVTFVYAALPAVFLMDATDGIFADYRGDIFPRVRPGDIVSVVGVSGPGMVAPVLLHARLTVLGHAPLPPAPLVSLDRISSGAWDSRWVALEGIVRSARNPSGITAYAGESASDHDNLILTLASGASLIDVITLNPTHRQAASLVDATVRVRAAVGSRFNQRHQLIGVHVYMPDLSCVRILRPAPADPFALPLATSTTMTRAGGGEPGHRVRLRGIVTSTFGNQHFSLTDARHGIFVTAADPASLRPGDRVDVVGFPSVGDYTSFLDESLVRRLGAAPVPPAVPLTAARAFTGAWDAEPIQLDGLLLDRSRGEDGVTTLLLTDAGTSFLAISASDAVTASVRALSIGSRLRLRGICVIHTNGDKTPESLSLLLRSPADITLLQAPSWWTTRHTLLLAAVLAVLVFIIATRNAGLRRRVLAQTRQIQGQLAEARALRLQAEAATQEKSQTLANLLTAQHALIAAQEKLRFQATHDALTGLWNRAALLDFLHKEIERTLRTRAPLGLLLLDVDHFKPVNDTHGHLAGDAVLREIGRRISRSTRPYDIAGRYGGEEFLVILPDCDSPSTQHSAERIRAAIGAHPFSVDDAQLSLTVSIGATVSFTCPPLHEQESDAELLSRADVALYEAKSAGRNRTVLRLPEAVASV